MEILRVSSWSQSLAEKFPMYNVILYDGSQKLYEFLEEVGKVISPQLKIRLSFCKNVKYSKPITVILFTNY